MSSITSSGLQLKLKRAGFPLAYVTVEHGALREGHSALGVYQDDCVGPDVGKEQWWEINKCNLILPPDLYSVFKTLYRH